MKLLTVLLGISLFFGRVIEKDEWKKIVPLKTTRAGVEALLGPAQGAYEVVYQLKDGHLSIEYSTGPCKRGQRGGWNVPENVVISLHFSPLRTKRPTDLKLNLTRLRKVPADDTPSYTYYINDEAGITYAVEKGRVVYIEYGPAKEFNDLYCKEEMDIQ